MVEGQADAAGLVEGRARRAPCTSSGLLSSDTASAVAAARRPGAGQPATSDGGAERGASTWGQPAHTGGGRSAALRRRPGPAQAAIGWLPGTPEPSRRPVALGQVDRGAAGRRGPGRRGAGPGEDQGVLALEEAVAADAAGGAALGGVLAERRDLDRARLGAGQGGRRAGRGDDDGRRRGRARRTRRPAAPAASRTPAMPPPERPCGRTASAPKCSSWASEVMKHSVSSPVAQLDGADDLVAVLEPDDLPLVLAEDLGVDPLDDALAGAEREPGPVGGAARSGPAPARRGRARAPR